MSIKIPEQLNTLIPMVVEQSSRGERALYRIGQSTAKPSLAGPSKSKGLQRCTFLNFCIQRKT